MTAAHKPYLLLAKYQIIPTIYLEFLAFASAAAALTADFAKAVGLRALFGFRAFRNFKAAHAVPTACPAASRPSLVALAACSPYLQQENKEKNIKASWVCEMAYEPHHLAWKLEFFQHLVKQQEDIQKSV